MLTPAEEYGKRVSRMANTLRIIPVLGVLVVLVSGCAKEPGLGAAISARSEKASKVAVEYKIGEKLVASGEKNVRAGQELLEQGQDQIREGQVMQETARRSFCEDTANKDPSCQ